MPSRVAPASCPVPSAIGSMLTATLLSGAAFTKNVVFPNREIRPMEQVTFLDNGNEISAVNPKTYIFEPNMSRGLEDDLIRTVNIPAVVGCAL